MRWLLLAFLATPECSSVALIDSLVARIEKASAKAPLQKLSRSEGANWTQDPSEDEAFEEAANVLQLSSGEWAVYTTSTSESGDWAQFVNYWFDKSGHLVKLKRDLRTFYGNIQIIETMYFNCSGMEIKRTRQSLDLETKKPATPGPEFIDRTFEVYKAIQRFPFYPLVRR